MTAPALPLGAARAARMAAVPALLAGSALAAVVVVWLFGDGAVSDSLPPIVGLGLVYGSLNALVAVGLVLVYRSSRVLNFAQAGFGIGTAMLYLLLATAWEWNWWLAVGAALAAAAVTGLVFEVFVVRRFARAPRLVLTVVTIAVGQALAGWTLNLPRVFGFEPDPDDPTGLLAGLPNFVPDSPVRGWTWRWHPVIFNGNHLLAIAVAVVVMVGLAAFFRWSRMGIAVRGAAENGDRAELLGINIHSLSTVVWVLSAVLAAAAGVLGAMVANETVTTAAGQGLQRGGGLAGAIGATVLVRALAAAVVARMERIPVAVAAAVGIAMVDQGIVWATDRRNVVDVVLLVVIVGALLAQRAGRSRVVEGEAGTWQAAEEIKGIPSQLAGLPQVRAGVRRGLWALAAAVVAYPWVMSPSQTNLGAIYAIYGIVGISLVVLTGWGGQISLGQFGLAAVGAAVGGATTANLGWPFPVAVVLGSLAGGVAAMAIGLPALRIKGLFLAVTTLAFAVAISTWFLALDWVPEIVDRPKLLWFDSSTDERTYYYLTVAALAFAVFVAQGMRKSRTGRVLIAMRDNERAAQSFGVNLVRSRLTAFAASGILAGFAGVLYAHHQGAVSPTAFGPEASVQMFLMAVIGGLGSVYAVLVGALYLGTATIVFDNAAGQLLASSLGVLVILLFLPTGLGSLVFRARDAWLRRIAMRNRIFVPSLVGDRVKEGEEARVPIAERLPEQGDVPVRYRLPSAIGEAGASQLTRLWRY